MDNHAIPACARRKEALNTIKTYIAKRTDIKYEKLVEKNNDVLCSKFPYSPHHENYTQIIHEAIGELISTKHCTQTRHNDLIWLTTGEQAAPD